jgi:hypothetical protein
MDLTTCHLVQGVGVPAQFNDVEGIAWPEKKLVVSNCLYNVSEYNGLGE